jgi:predicted alpha/beta superfamily hydrolase
MRGRLLWAVVLLLALPAQNIRAQLTVRVEAVPAGTPAAASIYIAGSFNNWNPGASEYALKREADHYAITLPATLRGPIEFKFTLGSWERVETDAAGGDIVNRSFVVPDEPATLTARIAGWRDGSAQARPSTASASVSIIDSMTIPQLGRTRRVWIYLPPDYATSGKRYPVLYMHDGQNVFDAATSYAGEWGVDETLDSLHAAGDPGVIVVAVDHGGSLRVPEYSPWPTRFGAGEGEKYVAFLVGTLKPWIDRSYRTLPDRLHTGIAGSSMGGLISFYAALRHPDVFGRAAVFSPAFWIAPSAYELAAQAQPRAGNRMYIISGGLEVAAGEAQGIYQRGQERMIETLAQRGFRRGTAVVAKISPDGKHAEWFWRREFAAAYQWLFQPKRKS